MTKSARRVAPALVLTAALLAAGCATATQGTGGASSEVSTSAVTVGAASNRIASMIVVGHSGATGWNSDPKQPDGDAKANSWSAGTNPAVQSIYQRLLATNPGVRDHGVNEAVSGSKVTDLDSQLDAAFRSAPTPDLVLIQTVDNDIQCDGTDDANYGAFRTTFAASLDKIATRSPHAVILVVSSPWATVKNFTEVVATLPGGKAEFTGTGPCDLFDSAGKPQAAHIRYQQDVIDKYLAQLADACAQISTCHDDGGALAHMPIVATDLTPDFNHLSIAGQAKQAALEWQVLSPLLKG